MAKYLFGWFLHLKFVLSDDNMVWKMVRLTCRKLLLFDFLELNTVAGF